MPLRPPAGFIRPGYAPLKVPNAPTIGTATGGDASASVAFTAPTNVGGSAISQYTAVSTNVLDYVTIASVANATDFGDLTVARSDLSACSNSHGGL